MVLGRCKFLFLAITILFSKICPSFGACVTPLLAIPLSHYAHQAGLLRLVREYYQDVDAAVYDETALSRALEIFSPNAAYQRGRTGLFKGIDAIKDFFLIKRKLRGAHTELRIRAKNNWVSVSGRFIGTNGEGDTVNFEFTDLWIFGSDDKVIRRESVLQIEDPL